MDYKWTLNNNGFKEKTEEHGKMKFNVLGINRNMENQKKNLGRINPLKLNYKR